MNEVAMIVNGKKIAWFSENHLIAELSKLPRVEKVIFNPPATIVLWGDGTKTVVKANEPRKKMVVKPDKIEFEDITAYDPEKGLAMCIAKKALGNKGNYYNEFKKWLKENE